MQKSADEWGANPDVVAGFVFFLTLWMAEREGSEKGRNEFFIFKIWPNYCYDF